MWQVLQQQLWLRCRCWIGFMHVCCPNWLCQSDGVAVRPAVDTECSTVCTAFSQSVQGICHGAPQWVCNISNSVLNSPCAGAVHVGPLHSRRSPGTALRPRQCALHPKSHTIYLQTTYTSSTSISDLSRGKSMIYLAQEPSTRAHCIHSKAQRQLRALCSVLFESQAH